MSQPTHAGVGVNPVLGKLKGYLPHAIMVIVVLSQGSGLVLGGALKSFQGSFSIVLVGTLIVSIRTIMLNGRQAHPMKLRRALISREVWLAGLRSLSWSSFTKPQQYAIIALAVTSALINLGGPVAVRELGSGLNAAFSTFGSLAVGVLALRYLPQWLGRGVALVAVLLAAQQSAGGGFTLLGLVAAIFAASHMWNLPKQVVRLKPRQNDGLTVANLISAPFVLIGTPIWDFSQGTSWSWGLQEIIGALCAGLLVMVFPVFLQNKAADLGLTEQDQGALQALASPLHAFAGWALAPITLVVAGTAAVQPNLEQIGLFVILAMAAVAVPLMPKRKPRQDADNGSDEAEAKVAEAEAKVAEAEAKAQRLQDELTARDAAFQSAEGWLVVESFRDVKYTSRGKHFHADRVTIRQGRRVVEGSVSDAFLGYDGQLKAGVVTDGTVKIDGVVVDTFRRGWAMKASRDELTFGRQDGGPSAGGSTAERVLAQQ